MNLHFSYKAKSPDVEKEIHQHVSKLERRLKVFRPDLIHLHGTLDSAPQNGYSISLNLRLPSGQLSARNAGTTAEAAVKAGFAELISQVDRHKDLLRNGHKWVRDKGLVAELPAPSVQVTATEESRGETRERNQRLSATQQPARAETDQSRTVDDSRSNGHATPGEITAATFEMENRTSVQSEVHQYLIGNLPRLERFVARELRFREANGQLSSGLVSREEVIDEVVLAALSVERRPANISLEKWIYRLCIHAIRLLASGNSIDLLNLPLEQSVGTPNVTGSDESFLQYHQPGEMTNRADVIADGSANPEQIAANDEVIEQLERALCGTKADQREAFVLFAIEGFTISEIAQITMRSAEQVRENVKSARDYLIKKLPPSNSLKKKLLQYSSVA